MAHPQKEPLRSLTAEERQLLEQTLRSRSERAERVARARVLLAIAAGASFTAPGRQAPEKRGGSSAPTGTEKPWVCPSGAQMRQGRIKRFPTQAPPGSPKGDRPASPTNTSGAARPSC